jgi:Holliday junction DNA helicase RuvA
VIAGVRGRIERKLTDALLVDVGGVILKVGTSTATLSAAGEVGEDIRLSTHLFVREDQLTLYGFAGDDELRLFEMLIGVTGVGPRLACAVLSHLRPEALHEAIQAGNVDLLGTVPGVGKKTAARLIVELRGKVPAAPVGLAPLGRDDTEVVAALRALGYTTAEAHAAVGRIQGATADLSVEERVVAALRELGQG